MLREYQETLTGDVLNLQAVIRRGEIDEGIEDQVDTIWEGLIIEKKIYRQGDFLDTQEKEGMNKIKYRDIS